MTMPTPLGPKVKRLLIERMATQAVERNSKYSNKQFGVACGIASDISRGKLAQDFRDARAFIEKAIALMRTAPDAKPDWTDEDIAGMILDKIDQRAAK